MTKKKKARNLKGMVIEETSLVKWGANDMPIFMAKSSEATKENTIHVVSKIYDDCAYVDRDTGERMHLLKTVWYRPNVVDLQGDIASTQEVADSFYDFMKNSREIKRNHKGDSGQGVVVEGYIANVDSIENDFQILKGDAIIGIGVNEATYQDYLNGEIGSVSMGGYAKETEEIELEKQHNETELGMFQKWAKACGFNVSVKKDDETDDENNNNNGENDMTREQTLDLLKEFITEHDAKQKLELEKNATPVVDVEDYRELQKQFTEAQTANTDLVARLEKAEASVIKASADIAEIIKNSGNGSQEGNADENAVPQTMKRTEY